LGYLSEDWLIFVKERGIAELFHVDLEALIVEDLLILT